MPQVHSTTNNPTASSSTTQIDSTLLQEHLISEEEYGFIRACLGRDLNIVELGVFSAMWSEHCSYKSTRVHLKNMHTKGSRVIQGPGENAGVIDVDDGDVAIFKMESHNHPSFIEPFSGAATGVGGIMRDIFTMGARPIANLNSLRFGEVNNQRTPMLVEGVVSGISYYGNCVGVPMLGGECEFDPSYNGNIVVNTMCVGVTKSDKVFYSAASKVGAKILYFGSKTGRDGIHGASMSSDKFSDTQTTRRRTVQVGDAFAEKLLIEACLDLMNQECVAGIQDMGAAGLTCSLAEMASKGGTGVRVIVDNVPKRFPQMTAYEVMLSESQERMLMTIAEGKENDAFEILKKYNIDFAVVGEITDTRQFIIVENEEIVCNLPVDLLTEKAPVYQRKYEVRNDKQEGVCPVNKKDEDALPVLSKLLQTPNVASKKFIWERYDSGVQNNTVQAAGESAGVVMFGEQYEVSLTTNSLQDPDSKLPFSIINHYKKWKDVQSFFSEEDTQTPKKIFTYETRKGLALSSDCTPRYVAANAKQGAIQAVAESYRNISATGATPIALTNCLNFGNPEVPEIMGQIKSAIEGISKAAKELDYPVVSGNVSLYNQTNSSSIKPTPVIGGVGLIKDAIKSCTIGLKDEEDLIIVIGETFGHLDNTLYATEIENKPGGKVPPVIFETEKSNSQFITSAINSGFVNACNDISSGGIAVALAKMAIDSEKWINGNTGFVRQSQKHKTQNPKEEGRAKDKTKSRNFLGAALSLHGKTGNLSIVEFLYSEDQGRYLATVPKALMSEFFELAIESEVIATQIGFTCNDTISINGVYSIEVEELKSQMNSFSV